MADANKYLDHLQQELQTLERELNSLGVRNPAVPEDWIPTPSEESDAEPDPNNLGDRSEDWQENRGVLDALETRFNNILRALAKIENQTYGTCEVCGGAIESERLDANPAARTCMTHLEEESSLAN